MLALFAVLVIFVHTFQGKSIHTVMLSLHYKGHGTPSLLALLDWFLKLGVLQPHAWFLIIASVRKCLHARVCVCARVCPRGDH